MKRFRWAHGGGWNRGKTETVAGPENPSRGGKKKRMAVRLVGCGTAEAVRGRKQTSKAPCTLGGRVCAYGGTRWKPITPPDFVTAA